MGGISSLRIEVLGKSEIKIRDNFLKGSPFKVTVCRKFENCMKVGLISVINFVMNLKYVLSRVR